LLTGPAWGQSLSDAVLRQVKSDPAPFLDLAANLIHGFGGARGIDRVGVDRFVALERAEGRASALRRLQVADLNFDGAITRDEMAVLVAAAAAKSRGRLWALFERADGSGDAVVKADEMLAYGRTEAMTSFSVADEALVRSVLTFDANADGLVALDEVRAAVAALGT
jgi:hypothetical protein